MPQKCWRKLMSMKWSDRSLLFFSEKENDFSIFTIIWKADAIKQLIMKRSLLYRDKQINFSLKIKPLYNALSIYENRGWDLRKSQRNWKRKNKKNDFNQKSYFFLYNLLFAECNYIFWESDQNRIYLYVTYSYFVQWWTRTEIQRR